MLPLGIVFALCTWFASPSSASSSTARRMKIVPARLAFLSSSPIVPCYSKPALPLKNRGHSNPYHHPSDLRTMMMPFDDHPVPNHHHAFFNRVPDGLQEVMKGEDDYQMAAGLHTSQVSISSSIYTFPIMMIVVSSPPFALIIIPRRWNRKPSNSSVNAPSSLSCVASTLLH